LIHAGARGKGRAGTGSVCVPLVVCNGEVGISGEGDSLASADGGVTGGDGDATRRGGDGDAGVGGVREAGAGGIADTAEGIEVRASPDAEGVGGVGVEGTAEGELDLGGGGGAGSRAANARRPRNIRSPPRRCKLKVSPIRSNGIAPHRAVKVYNHRISPALVSKGYGLR